jgi:hypothetical protein
MVASGYVCSKRAASYTLRARVQLTLALHPLEAPLDRLPRGERQADEVALDFVA